MILAILGLLANCAAEPVEINPAPPGPPPPRLTWLISDFHMGVGRVQQDPATKTWTKGEWHKTEDFRWEADFSAFMKAVKADVAQAKMPADLIILGDFLELWQSVINDIERRPSAIKDCDYWKKGDPEYLKNLGCTPGEALARAERVLGAHAQVLKELRDFANTGDNRVILVPGNHDAALVFDEVAKVTLDQIAAEPGRVRVAKEGYWRSPDGVLFAEHGHQMEGDVNKFDKLPASCVDNNADPVPCDSREKEIHLRRPWGEQFVQYYYNQFEEQFPIIDNISEETLGIRLGIATAGIGDTTKALANGLAFFLNQQSWDQFAQALGDKKGVPEWDLEAVKASGTKFMIDSIPSSDPLRALVEKAVAEGKIKPSIATLKDSEIKAICDYRFARVAAADKEGKLRDVEPCPQKKESLGAAWVAITSSELGPHRARLSEIRDGLRKLVPGQEEFSHYIYAHTHKAHAAKRPFDDTAKWKPEVWNTGAWQRLANPKQIDAIMAHCKLEARDALSKLQPENLAPCYTAIRYPSLDSPHDKPTLLWWAKPKGATQFKFFAACPEWTIECPIQP